MTRLFFIAPPDFELTPLVATARLLAFDVRLAAHAAIWFSVTFVPQQSTVVAVSWRAFCVGWST